MHHEHRRDRSGTGAFSSITLAPAGNTGERLALTRKPEQDSFDLG